MQYCVIGEEDQVVGKATVKQAGLYLQISCVCSLPMDKRWRIQVRTDDAVTDLGLCTPRDGGMGLYTCLPSKRLGAGRLQFSVQEESVNSPQDFVPISLEKPCPCIERLRNGRLSVYKGTVGILFTK